MATTITSPTSATYQAGGLASGLDTNKIVDSLVAIESQPLTTIASQQAAIAVQISSIATLMGNLSALGASATSLGKDGVAVLSATGNFTDYSVSGSAANAGRYTINVEQLARAAKARSTTSFSSVDAVVSPVLSTLSLKVNDVQYDVEVKANATLADVAAAINKKGAPFTASVISTGGQFYLTVTNKSTGFVPGQPPAKALEIVSDPGLGLITTGLQASNAVFWVDGLKIERTSNEVSDVIGGATLNLKANSSTDQEVVFSRDADATATKLQGFVDSYNKVLSLIASNINPPAGTKTDSQLTGGTLLGLQRRLQQLLSTNVNETGTVRTLRDLGVRLQKDGTATLDKTVLGTALAKDPGAVNSVFSQATTGISALVTNIVDANNNSTKGALVARRSSLQTTTKRLDDRTLDVQRHLDAFRLQLVRQFAAMEQMVNSFQSIGKFLDSQALQLKNQ